MRLVESEVTGWESTEALATVLLSWNSGRKLAMVYVLRKYWIVVMTCASNGVGGMVRNVAGYVNTFLRILNND